MISRATDSSYAVLQELRTAGEIAEAFLTATGPAEVYRVALRGVTPLVGAAFGCVFLRVPGNRSLLHVAAAHNWPDAYSDYLNELRIPVGQGPTGHTVAENRTVEVPDIFAHPELRDWWEPARELQFSSYVSLPLAYRDEPAGALTLYFREHEELGDADRRTLHLVADQLAGTAEKVQLIETLHDANARLRARNAALVDVAAKLRAPLDGILSCALLLQDGRDGTTEGLREGHELEKIERDAAALIQLVDGLQDDEGEA